MAPVVGWFGGHLADRHFHTAPWLGVAGLVLGIVAAFNELIRLSMRAMRETPVSSSPPDSSKTEPPK